MTAPLVASVTPARGHTGGRTLVQIFGAGFRMPPPYVPNGRAQATPPPPVRVLFGGVPCPAVQVVSDSILRVLTPLHWPDRWSYVYPNGVRLPAPPPASLTGEAADPTPPAGATYEQTSFGLVDVVVENIDATGAVIPGEVAELAAAYRYVRPEIGPYRGVWARVLTAFMEMLQLLLIDNVALNPSIDYDADTGDAVRFVELAQLPGIALTEVSFPKADEAPNEDQEVPVADDFVLIRKAPKVNDVSLTIVIVSNSQGEVINLSEQLNHVLEDWGALLLDRDPTNPAHGQIEVQIQVPQQGIGLSDRFGTGEIVSSQINVLLRNVVSTDLPGAPLEGLPQTESWMPHAATIGITRTVGSFALLPRTRSGG